MSMRVACRPHVGVSGSVRLENSFNQRRHNVGKNQNTFEKRRREVEKRQKAEEKRKRREQKKTEPASEPSQVILRDGELVIDDRGQ